MLQNDELIMLGSMGGLSLVMTILTVISETPSGRTVWGLLTLLLITATLLLTRKAIEISKGRRKLFEKRKSGVNNGKTHKLHLSLRDIDKIKEIARKTDSKFTNLTDH